MRKFPRNDPQQNIPALKATNKVTVIVYMKSTRTGKTYVVSVWAEDPGKKKTHTQKQRTTEAVFTWCRETLQVLNPAGTIFYQLSKPSER